MGRKLLESGVLGMDKVREVLRLHSLGFSQRSIHRSTGVTRSVIQDYIIRAEAADLCVAKAQDLSDEELRSLLGKKTPGRNQLTTLEPDYSQIHKEYTSRKGVTLELLWSEWVENTGEAGFSYSTFCRRYREYKRQHKVVMRQAYNPGELLLSDYAGETLSYWDELQCAHHVEIFVATLGFSNRIYAEASASQQVTEWIGSHIRAFGFFGGVTAAIRVDNLKSAVAKVDLFEPGIQKTFEEFASHYTTAIFPARSRKPRDKAKVEQAVQQVERDVLAPLRHRRFLSLQEINQAIASFLPVLNAKIMKDYGMSREELYLSIEKQSLLPLPKLPFVVARWKFAKVAMDYHVEVERHRYSVPYQHVKKIVQVKITEKLIEIFLDNQRIASHPRCHQRFRFSTTGAHMPDAHQAVRGWTEAAILDWARSLGAGLELFTKRVLNLPRYKPQSYRALRGLKSLVDKHGVALCEAAAIAALQRQEYSLGGFRELLKIVQAADQPVSASHENIRGESYYH
jgi:transposase